MKKYEMKKEETYYVSVWRALFSAHREASDQSAPDAPPLVRCGQGRDGSELTSELVGARP